MCHHGGHRGSRGVPPSLGDGRARVSDADLSDSVTHILSLSLPGLWSVSHTGCKREIIEISI